MKITDSESIKKGENELIDSLIGELDWQAIEFLLKEKYKLRLHDDVEYKRGDLVVYGDSIAYKLDFDVRVTLSLVVGRDGECKDIKASGSEMESGENGAVFSEEDEKIQDSIIDEDEFQRRNTRNLANVEQEKKREKIAVEVVSIIDEINN